MPLWNPDQRWTGRDVFIIGGGPSLRGFDFERLRGQATIGCNSAFRLGQALCNVCFFSDLAWFEKNYADLERFRGDVVTHCEELTSAEESWLKRMRREHYGLHHDALGYGGNSGCSAINLALIMGAKRVFLLGMDCKPGPNHRSQPNWHNHHIEIVHPEVFLKFDEGFRAVARDLPRKFPNAEIINLGPDSALDCFKRRSADLYL